MLWHPYHLSRVAVFEGPEGVGFSARLIRHGATVAHLLDEGNNGPLLWTFLGNAEARQRHEQELDAYAEGLPMEADETQSFDDWCRDAFALRLFEDHQAMQHLHAQCQQRMVLLVPHIQRGHVPLILPFAYDPSVRALVLARYGAGTLILNELPRHWWADPGHRPSTGRGQSDANVLGTTTLATQRQPSAGGLPQHPPPMVGRDVRLPRWDLSYS
jgi:hypothetical protein